MWREEAEKNVSMKTGQSRFKLELKAITHYILDVYANETYDCEFKCLSQSYAGPNVLCKLVIYPLPCREFGLSIYT